MPAFFVNGNSAKAITEQSFPDGIFRQSDSSYVDILTLYKEVSWMRRGVDIIAQAVSSMPRSLHKAAKGTNPNAEAPLVNEDDLEFDLNENLDAWAGDFILHGAAYGAWVANAYNIPKRLVRYVPTSIEPTYSAAEGLTGFKRRVDGKEYSYDRKGLMYCWATNRKEEVGNGSGAASAAERAARVLNNTGRYYENYYANGAVNPTIISVSGDSTEADHERIKAWYKRVFTGIRNAFKVSIISGEVKATSLGNSPKDLAAGELTTTQREEVATALGVPHSLLFSNAANFATAGNDSLMFYELTVKPLAEKLFKALNKLLHPIGYHLEMHPELLEVYQKSEIEKAQALIALRDAGLMSDEEVRLQLGLAAPVPTASAPPEKALTSADDGVDYEHVDAVKADIRKLGNVARNRLKEGGFAKVQSFTSAVIATARLDALKARVMACADNKAIDRVIGEALLAEAEWIGYG